MSRINIALPANPGQTAIPGKAPVIETDANTLDQAFQKFLLKLNGELARDTNGETSDPEPGKPSVPGDRVAPQPTEPGARHDGLPHREIADRDLPDEADSAASAQTSETPTSPVALPEFLQAVPLRADTQRFAGPVAPPSRSEVTRAGIEIDHTPKGTVTPATRNPFAALTEMLARENLGSEPETLLPDAPVKAPNMTVLARETHFEPVVRAPVQQVATSIVSELATIPAEPEAPTRASEVESLSLRKPMEGPLKILHIKLQPDDLGEVTVKMRLVGEALELRLETSRPETAELLLRDKDMLHRLLRSSGYSPDVVTIQAAADSGTNQSMSQTGQNGNSSQNPAAFQNGAQPDGRRPSGDTAASNSPAASETTNDDVPGSPDGDLYL